MAEFQRVRTVFTGVPGTPWYSNLYFAPDDATGQIPVDAVITFWTALAASMDNALTITVEDTVTVLESTTGQPVNVLSATGDAFPGEATQDALPPANQVLVRLDTGVFQNGRQIRGHMFLPGLVTAIADPDGTVDPTFASGVADLVRAMTNEPGNVAQLVYSRTGGVVYPVDSVSVPTKFAVLRSRRD